MIEKEILTDSIHTGRRPRDLGDIEALANSIAKVGLIHPITVARGDQLVLGPRRLAAVKLLGWPKVPGFYAESLDEVIERMRLDAEDDIEGKPLLPSEKVALGMALEWVNEPIDRARRQVISRTAHARDREPMALPERERTSYRVPVALGLRRQLYNRLKHLFGATNHVDPEVRRVARELWAAVNRGEVSPYRAYDEVRPLTRARAGMPMLQAASRVPPPSGGGMITGATAQRRALNAALLALHGVVDGLVRVADIDDNISPDEAAQWVGGLAESRRTIERTINRLRQHTAKGNVT